MLWPAGGFYSSGSMLVSHRRAASLHRLVQMVVVGQYLHEEVELQSLRLQDKNPSQVTQTCLPGRQRALWVRGINKHQWRTDLWLFILHTPDAIWTIHNRVLWHHLARVDVAARTDDAATGQDHVSPKISWDLILVWDIMNWSTVRDKVTVMWFTLCYWLL